MTQEDCNELCLALERYATGAYAHTSNKARMYLKELVGKPNAKFSNCSQEQFIATVRHALSSNKWQALTDLMGRWW